MKNIHLFSDNPLNTEKFLYYLKSSPSRTNAAREALKEGPKATPTEVASAQDRLRIMLKIADKRINTLSGRLKKNYKKIRERMVNLNNKLHDAIDAANGDYTKVSSDIIKKINAKIMKSTSMNWFRKSLMKGILKESARQVIKNGDISGFKDLFSLMTSPEKMKKRIEGHLFIALKKGDKMIISYRGKKTEFTVNAANKDLKWEMKGEDINKKTAHLALSGLWDTKKDRNIPDKLFYDFGKKNGTGQWAQLYRRVSTRKSKEAIAAKKKPAETKETKSLKEARLIKALTALFNNLPTQGIDQIIKGDIKDQLGKIDENINAGSHYAFPKGKDRALFTFTKSADGNYLRLTMKGEKEKGAGLRKAVNSQFYISISPEKEYKVLNPAKSSFDKNIQFAADPLNKKETLVAKKTASKKAPAAKTENFGKDPMLAIFKDISPEKQRQLRARLTAYGKEVRAEITKVLRTLTAGNLTVTLAFMKAVPGSIRDKQRALDAYKRRLQGISDKIKDDNGENIPKYVNQLAEAYKAIPNKLDYNMVRNRVMVAVKQPRIKGVVIASNVLNRTYQESPLEPSIAAPTKAVAAKEAKESAPTLTKWASKNEKILRNIRKEFILKNGTALQKMYGKYQENVLVRLSTLNTELKDPKITFKKAVEVCHNLRRGFRDLQKRAIEKKINYVDANVKKQISNMTTLDFPPAPANPTVAEQKLLATENQRINA